MDKTQAFLNPNQLVDELNVPEGVAIADFGAGAGDITILLAKIVGPSGVVTAVDVQTGVLEALSSKADLAGVRNIKTVLANLEVVGSTRLKDKSQNLVILANVLFQSKLKTNIIQEAKRVLDPEGRLVVIDWLPAKQPPAIGPAIETRLSPEQAKQLVDWPVVQELKTVGDYHFGLVFQPGS